MVGALALLVFAGRCHTSMFLYLLPTRFFIMKLWFFCNVAYIALRWHSPAST
jgi:hypothetical protein